MHLYAGTSTDFIREATLNTITSKLVDAFQAYYRRSPSPGEQRSWQNSLLRMSLAIDHGGLHDHGVILEYELPLTSLRLDCMVLGESPAGARNAVVVELKQWDKAEPSETLDCVRTYVNKGVGDQLHPSRQVEQYTTYLSNFHTVFSTNHVGLSGCAYLHNYPYDPESEIFAGKFKTLLEGHPTFAREHQTELITFLKDRVGAGRGQPVLDDVLASRIRPSQKLMDSVAEMVRGQSQYVLLDTQLVAFNQILGAVEGAAKRQRKKSVFIIAGGPGTGKSVVALNLMGELSGRGFTTLHATGSRAFTSNLVKLADRPAAPAFKYFNNFAMAPPNTVDCLVLDEAHRIRATSVSRFTRKEDRSGKPQIQELIDVAKVSVFFIDDLQIVRPAEVGSRELVRAAAVAAKAEVYELELQAQFRCGGSEGFVNWVDNTLGVRETPNVMWKTSDPFEFRVFESAQALEDAIRAKAETGESARMTAGFCWPWSEPNDEGELVADVTIGEWARPWNAKPDSKRRLANGIPKSNFWATDPNGLGQVGCIYTAQGFEFDYVGVIVGPDFRRDLDANQWIGDKPSSADRGITRGTTGDQFLDLVRNVYRVLFTRGMKGCYVYFTDDATRQYFLSRTEP